MTVLTYTVVPASVTSAPAATWPFNGQTVFPNSGKLLPFIYVQPIPINSAQQPLGFYWGGLIQ